MHVKSYATMAVILVMYLLIAMIWGSVNKKPERIAVSHNEQGYKPLKVRASSSITDRKVMDFASKVIATCFSLTPLNVQSKSEYCAQTYFRYNPAEIYKKRYAAPLGKIMKKNESTTYSVIPRKPIIISTPKRGQPYYVVYATTLSTTVTRSGPKTHTRNVRLWIVPTLTSVNAEQFNIIGVRI